MTFRCWRLTLCSALLLPSACILTAASDDAPPILTVCEALSELQRYEGRSIIVVGRFSSTDEGSWLDEECALKVVREEREFPTVISIAYAAFEFADPPQKPRGFRWDKRLLQQKLDQVTRTTHLQVHKDLNYSDQWLAVFGRLETHLPRQVKTDDSRYAYTNGFGHLSGAPAQLIAPANGYLALKAK